MATVIENDNCRYEVVKVLNPDGQVLNVSLSSGSASTTAPSVSNDAFGRLRVSEPFTLFDSSHRYSDNGLWATSTASGGAVAHNANEGLMDLSVTTTSGSSVIRETVRVFAYQPGKSLLVMNTGALNAGKTGLRQRFGNFNADNGFFFQLDGTTASFVSRSSVTGSAIDTTVTQANWNIDSLDGTGPSGITLDPTKVQILWADYEWLGAGNVRMGFVYNGQLVHCHTFQHANITSTTYITTATLPIRYEITNTAATASNSTLKQICSTVLSEGGYQLRGRGGTINTPITSSIAMATAGDFYPLVSIRLQSTRLDAVVVPTGFSVLGASNTINYNWRLVLGGTSTGGTWTAVAGGSPVEFNRTITSFTGGRVVAAGFVSGSVQGNAPVDLSRDELFKYQLQRDGLAGNAVELTLLAAGSGNNANAFAAMNWDEVVY